MKSGSKSVLHRGGQRLRVVAQNHGLGGFVENSWDGDGVGHERSGLVESVDFAEELLKIVLPAELVAEESVLDRVRWLPDSESLSISHIERFHVLLEDGSSIGEELHFGLLQQTVVDTLVKQDSKSEEAVHGEDKDFATVRSSFEEKFFRRHDFSVGWELEIRISRRLADHWSKSENWTSKTIHLSYLLDNRNRMIIGSEINHLSKIPLKI